MKRLVITVLGAGLLLLNRKLGLNLEETEILGIAGFLSAYVFQSGLKSAKQIEVSKMTNEEVLADLRKGPQP